MKKCILFLLSPLVIFAKIALPSEEGGFEGPWFTGPLIATAATTVPVGHWAIEPYIYAADEISRYNSHWSPKSIENRFSLIFQPYIWVGLTDWADLQILPTWRWCYRDHAAKWTFNDFSAKLEFQLYRDTLPHKSWIPSIKFSIQETFPCGKYQHLNPKKLTTDVGGNGAFNTLFQLAFGRQVHVSGAQWLQWRLVLDYNILTSVNVSGFNFYGGGYGAKGKVHHGQQARFDASIEYSLTRNWALACDFIGLYQGSRSFTGNPGKLPDGTSSTNSQMASIQYQIAPAIEYNWSAQVGVIAGVWFTFAGKNTSEFYTGVFAFNYYH